MTGDGKATGVIVLYHSARDREKKDLPVAAQGRAIAEQFIEDATGQALVDGEVLFADLVDPKANATTYNTCYQEIVEGRKGPHYKYAVAIYISDERSPNSANLPLEIGMWLGYRGDHDLVVLSVTNPGKVNPGPPSDLGFIDVIPVSATGEDAFEQFAKAIRKRRNTEAA